MQTQVNTLYGLLLAFYGFVWVTNHHIVLRPHAYIHSRRVLSKLVRVHAFINIQPMLSLKRPESVEVEVRVNEARALVC